MAVFFAYLFLFSFLFLFFPMLLFSCPNQLWCENRSIEINYPFYTNITCPKCKGSYMIQCHGSTPFVNFYGHRYGVKSISYPENVLALQDAILTQYLHESHCSFLYNFTVPIHRYNLSCDLLLSINDSFFDCTWDDYEFSKSSFNKHYNATICKDYSFYYWNEWENESHNIHSANCLAAQSAGVELTLSFSDGDHSLSLLSAGFSYQLEL